MTHTNILNECIEETGDLSPWKIGRHISTSPTVTNGQPGAEAIEQVRNAIVAALPYTVPSDPEVAAEWCRSVLDETEPEDRDFIDEIIHLGSLHVLTYTGETEDAYVALNGHVVKVPYGLEFLTVGDAVSWAVEEVLREAAVVVVHEFARLYLDAM